MQVWGKDMKGNKIQMTHLKMCRGRFISTPKRIDLNYIKISICRSQNEMMKGTKPKNLPRI
jgi:hypothetical protein